MDMKEFVKWVLAVLCGLFIWGIVKAIMFFMMIGSLAATYGSGVAPILPKEGVLVMDMAKTSVTERTSPQDPRSLLQGNMVYQIGIWETVKALRKAAEDPGVLYLLIKTDNMTTGISQLEELRKALTEFRKSGKAVIAYGETFTTGSYYLASAADKIYTTGHHGGNTFLLGMSGQLMFVKDLLDKLGVNVQLIRHGKYKSAGEMFVKNAPSPENLEQNQKMIDSMWETIGRETAESRRISLDSLNLLIDNLGISFPEDLVKYRLADEILTTDAYKTKLAALASKEQYKDVKFMAFKDYVDAKVKPEDSAKKKIAIIYAEGNIVEGDKPDAISGDRYASIIAKVRADSSVKAVVFRVNSPGGTVLSAGKIKEQIDLTRAVKPVIASYGSYAASGGYWISNSCDRIFSDATTLTGSIGVFAMIPDFSKTLKEVVRINATPVNSHKHSDMLSMTRPFDTEETAWMQGYIEDIYTRFVNVVAEGRDMNPSAVDSIAQGRVWTGSDALKIGLVDEIGTLADALEYTAGLAGDADLNAWGIAAYPKQLSPFQQLLQQLGQQPEPEEAAANLLKGTPFEQAAREMLTWQKTWVQNAQGTGFVFARMPYVIDIR